MAMRDQLADLLSGGSEGGTSESSRAFVLSTRIYLLPPMLRRVRAGGHIGRPTFVPTMLLTSETPRDP